MQRKIQKKSFVSEIIVSELLPLNSLYKENNTCHRRSVCVKKQSSRFLQSTNRDFFQLNYVYRDEQIW